jgi:hypothetical protein
LTPRDEEDDMDDCFDEFNDDFDESFDGDDFGDHDLGDDETEGDRLRAEPAEEAWNGPSWQDWMIIGPLAESLAREKRERERIRREYEADDDSRIVIKRER